MNKFDWLKNEISSWQKKKIINEKQAVEIRELYKEEGSSEKKIVQVLGSLGAILVAAGMLLFVASNWEYLPKMVKLVILFGTTFATYYAGWKTSVIGKHPLWAKTLLFLASLFVGATIFLTAQIFNVNANAHWLILLWFLAIAPLGYLFDMGSIMLLAALVFSLWFVNYLADNNAYNHSSFGIFLLLLVYGISLYGKGQLHEFWPKFKKFKNIYQSLGLVFILSSYLFFSLESPYQSDFGVIISEDWLYNLLLIVFGIGAIGSTIMSGVLYKKKKEIKQEFWVLFLSLLGGIGIFVFSFFAENFIEVSHAYNYKTSLLNENVSTILFIIYNLFLFVLSIGSLLIGYYKRITSFVNIGMLFFVIGTAHLYTTTLYEFLPRSLAFVVGGLILLAGGFFLERRRREIITATKPEKISLKRFLTLISLPAAVILLFISIKVSTLFSGTEIILKVRPVDPRDLFRGDYVTLAYDISNIDGSEVDEGYYSFYLIMEEKNGEWLKKEVRPFYYKSEGPTLGKNEICIEGRVVSRYGDTIRAEYGIESYFVPEGQGKEIEDARNKDKVSAVIRVGDNCQAVLKDLKIEN